MMSSQRQRLCFSETIQSGAERFRSSLRLRSFSAPFLSGKTGIDTGSMNQAAGGISRQKSFES